MKSINFPFSQPGLKENPALHFDAEAFEEAKQLLYVRNNQINIVAGDGKFSTMRNLLGKSLHSMQKFYAHSNWVEMGNDAILDLIWDDFGNLASNKTDTCHEDDLTVDVLTSGYFHYNVSYAGWTELGGGNCIVKIPKFRKIWGKKFLFSRAFLKLCT